jgi:hypothetical protein
VDQVGKDSRCEGLWITDNPAAGFIKLHGIDQVLTLKKRRFSIKSTYLERIKNNYLCTFYNKEELNMKQVLKDSSKRLPVSWP